VSYKFENGTLTITNSNTTTAEGISIDLSRVDRTAVTKLVIVGGFNGTSNNDFVNNSDWAITEIDLSQAVLGTSWQFKNMYQLSKIDWPTTGSFEIPAQAFQTTSDNTTQQYSQLTDVTIPTNCTKIGSQAFENHCIKNLTIAGPSTYIVSQAFGNCKKISSVTVVSGEEKDASGTSYCATGAFDQDVTYVGTDLSKLANAASLTFPTGEDAYFCQNMDIVTQSMLSNTFKSSATNGWQEFIYNHNLIVKETSKVIRTFSDTYEHTFPACDNPGNGIEVFYVTGTTVSDDKTKANLQQMNKNADYVLPANTGILLYSTKGMLIYKSTKNTGLARVSQYVGNIPGLSKTNYLESLQDAPDKLWMTWKSTIGSTEYRNMFLSDKSETNTAETGWGFYSIIPKYYTHADDYAYRAFLNMPTSVCSAEILQKFVVDGGNNIDPDTDNAKILNLDFSAADDETTGISAIKTDTNSSDDAYYTLAGIKVSKPEKGLYIHNGKKVIFK
jgi:hypothetical protein